LKVLLIAFLTLFLLAGRSAARGDIVTLSDGSRVEGRIIKTTGGWLITQEDGQTISVMTDQVVSIEVSRSASQPSEAQEGLASLRRAQENVPDIPTIIEHYQRFISQTTDPDVVALAKQDLQTWQERLDAGLVKVGNQWVTPQEELRMQAQGQTEALAARDLILQGKYADAETSLKQALADDPENATAFYLDGVMRFHEKNLADARAAFMSVDQIAPGHGPTLNNLAVIAWQSGAAAQALGYYDQAMRAAPDAREILDNVAEALNALPEENRDTLICRRVADRFAEQDAALQQTLNKQGLFRWGSTWVTAQQLSDLKAAQAKSADQQESLSHEYDGLGERANEIDSEIDQNTREMHRMEASSYVVGVNGVLIQVPYPQSYYDLQSDNQKLAQDKQNVQAKRDDLHNQLLQAQQDAEKQLTVPQYTGIQKILGVEAAPLRAGSPPSTIPSEPATQP
jgi:tetratricopeptide (TPR) repeat protein